MSAAETDVGHGFRANPVGVIAEEDEHLGRGAGADPEAITEVTAKTEQRQHDTLDREKLLHVRIGFEPTRLSLALSRWLVRDLRPIVLVLPRTMDRGRSRGG